VQFSHFSLPEESKQFLPHGGYWTHLVVAWGRIYLRDQEWIFCYDINGQRSRGEQRP
jgi:hypothetical protein